MGKKFSRTSKQCSVPCQKKVPLESDGIHQNPSDSHGNRWGRVKPSIILSYEFHMERRHSVAQDATGMVFFLILCFHMVVSDHTSLLMHMWELPYMASMLVNYALFYISHL